MQGEVEEEELPRTHLNTNKSCGNAKRSKQGTESLLLFFFCSLDLLHGADDEDGKQEGRGTPSLAHTSE